MLRNIGLSLGLLLLLSSACRGQTPRIIYSDDLLKQYPSDPSVFQERYGGDLIYYKANKEMKEKTANIDKAQVKGDGFVVTFWKSKEYYIRLIKITKSNKIKIGTVDVIGMKIEDIKEIFGIPGITSEGALDYNGKNTSLTLGIEGDVITSCYWGYDM